MKTLYSRVIATHVAAALLILSLPADAQLAASGTPGDRAVYTIGTGASIEPGLGNSVIHNFATTAVEDTADSFDLQAGGAESKPPRDPKAFASKQPSRHQELTRRQRHTCRALYGGEAVA